MPLPSGLSALANRDFRVYYAGNLVAQVGSWMQTVSQSWLVLQLTDSPFLLGLTATLQSGPILLLAVFTGVLADRLTGGVPSRGKEKWRILPVGCLTTNRPSGKTAAGGMRHGEA